MSKSMFRVTTALFTAAVITALNANTASAVAFDQDVTPDVIFGSGNANGSFTTNQGNGIELGLRTKLRFDGANSPANIFSSNADGSYTFLAGPPPAGGGFGFCSDCNCSVYPVDCSTPIWNFEWSVNTDYDGSSGLVLSDLTYELGIDFDPDPSGTNFLTFDQINLPFADHAIGDNSTGNGAGVGAANAAAYIALIDSKNVAQNSWSMEFFNNAPFDSFDANDTGVYDIYLAAFDGATEVARTQIQVIVGGPCSGDTDCDDGDGFTTDMCDTDTGVAPGVCVNRRIDNIVPTVSEWGLLVMSLLGCTLGTIAYGRRRMTRTA